MADAFMGSLDPVVICFEHHSLKLVHLGRHGLCQPDYVSFNLSSPLYTFRKLSNVCGVVLRAVLRC